MPITMRVALLAALLALAANVAIIEFVSVRTSDQSEVTLRGQVAEQAIVLTDAYRTGGFGQLRKTIDDLDNSPDVQAAAAILDSAGRAQFGNIAAITAPADQLQEGYRTGLIRLVGQPSPQQAGIDLHRLGAGRWLVSARVSGDDLLLRETLERSLLFSLVLSILLGSTCGLIVAGYVDRRVRNIAALAERIGNGALNERLPVKRSREAFEELSRAINAMLDRIGSLLNELRMLTDALAHDLRSPVGRLRAAADRALTANRNEVQESLLPRIVREADDLMRLLTTVLEIGKSDSLASRKQFSWFDAAQLGAEMTEMYEPLVEEAGCSIHFEQLGRDFLFHGHRQLLAQALSNMVENAIKYAAEGHEIRLFATRDMDSLRIGVADLGPGIPEEQMAQARRRFGRLDASRSKPGAGLGLALIESVANLHSGRLELANRYPGLLVTLVFQMPHPK